MQKTKIEWCDYKTGGSVLTGEGYVLIYCPKHPYAHQNGFVLEHRFIMEKHLKRFLSKGENVHHKNNIRSDNRIENLELTTPNSHTLIHWNMLSDEQKRQRGVHVIRYQKYRKLSRALIFCKCGCGQQIEMRDCKGRLREFIHGHNQRGRTWGWEKCKRPR